MNASTDRSRRHREELRRLLGLLPELPENDFESMRREAALPRLADIEAAIREGAWLRARLREIPSLRVALAELAYRHDPESRARFKSADAIARHLSELATP